jgi:thymidylate synthase ThyX
LPAATTANVGVFASGQAYEAMLLRMRAHPLAEARECAAAMLAELRQVVPSFLTRVDREDRGVVHSAYLTSIERAAAELAERIAPPAAPDDDVPQVRLVDFDPEAERRVLAHALIPHTNRSLTDVTALVDRLSAQELADALLRVCGERSNRRHKPGRALEAAVYTFEIVCDYGAYRDLQRHRMLSLQAQPLSVSLGYATPEDVVEAGCADDYAEAQEESAALFRALSDHSPIVAPYAVTLAHRIRFVMVINAREAMHLIELRSQPQGHESYRRVAQLMHDQIADVAGHRALAKMMSFVDHSIPAAGRLAAERRTELKRPAAQ